MRLPAIVHAINNSQGVNFEVTRVWLDAYTTPQQHAAAAAIVTPMKLDIPASKRTSWHVVATK